ncbi:MAG: type II toxin-antitoxin system RelE/ParE family toxin [Atopobiaceae bacterium]|nr:type II toxin-antitoxin system RelE/ParE family toxin [Atopobiaceae bacterium]
MNNLNAHDAPRDLISIHPPQELGYLPVDSTRFLFLQQLVFKVETRFWRYRVGDYRIICDIEDAVLVILVVEVNHRSKVYKTR